MVESLQLPCCCCCSMVVHWCWSGFDERELKPAPAWQLLKLPLLSWNLLLHAQ